MPDLNVLLISTYELGRQPFGLASPAAWLRAAGFHTTSLDLSTVAGRRSGTHRRPDRLLSAHAHRHADRSARAGGGPETQPLRPPVRIWTVRPGQCRPAASFGRRYDPGGRV